MSCPNATTTGNGRVDLLGHAPIALFDPIPVETKASAYLNATQGGWYNTPLSIAFFSAENVQALQNQLRFAVFEKTNFAIGIQDYDTLKSIMWAVFLRTSRNLPTNLKSQIQCLNSRTLEIATRSVLSGLESHIAYVRDISTLAVPPRNPILTSTKGQQPLEFKGWF
jgi:hypothetical protein